MRLRQAKIFGFGKWVDYSLDFPKTGPLFLYGENESGKTTFHQFILFMLFGMPPRQRKFYQPKTSSKFGGQLVIEDAKIGKFTIERFDDRNNGAAVCYKDTGEQYPESWLEERLHHMNQKTFEAVFSFSALDLNKIEEMDETDLGEVLLSIGLTGSDNIYHVEKQLDARMDELFKPTGRKPEINEQLKRLDVLKSELEANKKEEASYRDKVLKADALEKQLLSLQKDQKRIKAEIDFITKQHTALPIIHEYQFLSAKKGSDPEAISFPENGIDRLEKIKEQMLPLESELAVLKNNEVSYNENIERNRTNLLPEDLIQELQQKQAEIEKYDVSETKLETLHSEEAKLLNEISEQLEDLQIGLQQTDLHELVLPFYIEETWKQLQSDKVELDRDALNLESEKAGLEKEFQYLRDELNQKNASLLSHNQITDMRSKLEEGKELKQLNQLYDETLKMKRNVETEKKQKYKKANQLLGLSVILFSISIAAAYFMDQNVFYGISLIFLLGGVGQWFFTRQNISQLEAILEQPMKWENKASITEEAMFAIERQLKEEEAKQLEIQRFETAIQNQHILFIKWEEKERMHLERKQRMEQQIEEQFVLYPFLEKINLNYWPEYYRRLKYILKQNETYLQLYESINSLQQEQSAKKEELRTFCEQKFPDQKLEKTERIAHFIQEELDKDLQMKDRLQREEELLSETLDSISSIIKRISVYQQEIDTLLQAANTTTEEAFYKLANDVHEKNQLKQALEVNQRQLEATFPEGLWKDFIHETIDEVALKKAKKKKESNKVHLEHETESIRSQLAALLAELKRMESSDTYSEKLHQFEMEKEKLNQLAKEWSILKIEKETLTETKQVYREKYLSRVLEETASIFQVITGGNYIDVHAPKGKELFQIRAADGLRYTVNELSQGTVNQLYISLRLAISKVMTEKEQLPFILDDAFVHFDEIRVKRMLEVIADIGTNQQVIMFTCKNDVRNACEELRLPINYII